MGRKMILVAFVAVVALGCNKNKNAVVSAAEEVPTELVETSPQPSLDSKTEVAQGDLRELLLVLQRVHFGFDASALVEDARASLDEAAKSLTANEGIKLWVDGHTDERGTTEHNMALSERRAQSVVSYLSDLGVPGDRLSVVSHGEEALMAPGASQVDHAQNRRVDFRLMKGEIQLVLEEGTLVDDDGKTLSSVPSEVNEEKSSVEPIEPTDDADSKLSAKSEQTAS